MVAEMTTTSTIDTATTYPHIQTPTQDEQATKPCSKHQKQENHKAPTLKATPLHNNLQGCTTYLVLQDPGTILSNVTQI